MSENPSDPGFYPSLAARSLGGECFDDDLCSRILHSPEIELLPLVHSAFEVRKKFWGRDVMIHIIGNAQNGHCPEDCGYCPQARTSEAGIEEYPLKSEDEILKEAEHAHKSGAYRYCIVSAGRGPSEKRVELLSNLIRKIKERHPIRICLSAGLCNEEGLRKLKDAGLDRLNHNLNTSEEFYPSICTTHTFQDRMNTLKAAQRAGVEICSGMIVGMGETHSDVIRVAKNLRALESPSIPVNFLVPIEGNRVAEPKGLSPEYALRVLCLFRFLNPKAEIRAAAGREGHLRSLEALCLYPANSIFLDGYLNTRCGARARVLQMIRDAGFTVSAEQTLEKPAPSDAPPSKTFSVDGSRDFLKSLSELRPALSKG
jgi:biotin synthase